MHKDSINDAVTYLAEVRRRNVLFDTFPDGNQPRDVADGYTLQDALHDRLGVPVVGYKIGCTTAVMQKFLNIAQPCGGSIQETDVHPSPAVVPHRQFQRVGVECEIAVCLGRDLPPGDTPFNREQIGPAVEACMPAIEIVDDRYVDYKSLDAATLIADDFFGAGCVLGPACHDWQRLDLATTTAAMHINDEKVGDGTGAQVMGHPFEALAWLANTLAQRGCGLKKGQIVLTGSIVETQWVARNDKVRVSVAGLGEAEIRFT